jgi:hypothetical protein
MHFKNQNEHFKNQMELKKGLEGASFSIKGKPRERKGGKSDVDTIVIPCCKAGIVDSTTSFPLLHCSAWIYSRGRAAGGV